MSIFLAFSFIILIFIICIICLITFIGMFNNDDTDSTMWCKIIFIITLIMSICLIYGYNISTEYTVKNTINNLVLDAVYTVQTTSYQTEYDLYSNWKYIVRNEHEYIWRNLNENQKMELENSMRSYFKIIIDKRKIKNENN